MNEYLNEYLLIYLITRCDEVKLALGGIHCLLFIISLVVWIIHAFCAVSLPACPAAPQLKKISIILGGVLTFLLCSITIISPLIPSTNEAMLIAAGGSTIQYAKKDKNLRAIPFKTSELVAEMLDKKLKELKGK